MDTSEKISSHSTSVKNHNDLKSTSSTANIKVLIPLLITTVSALLYVAGMAYYEAFLATFGLLKSQFPISFDITLFKGFASIATFGIRNILHVFFSVICITLFAIVIETSLSQEKRHKIKCYLKNKYPTTPRNKLGTSVLFRKIYILFEITSVVTMLFFLMVLSILTSAGGGKAQAENLSKRCEQDSTFFSVIAPKGEQAAIQGCPITCSSHQCAYIEKRKVMLVNNDGTLYGHVQLLKH